MRQLHYLLLLLTVVAVQAFFQIGRSFLDVAVYPNVVHNFESNPFGTNWDNYSELYVTKYRPLIPWLAHLVAISMRLHPVWALAYVNFMFWLLSTIIIFHFMSTLLKDDLICFYSAVLFISAVPVIRLGTSAMIDLPVYVMLASSLYFAYHLAATEQWRFVFAYAFVTGIGLMIKEVMIVTFASLLILMIQYHKTTWHQSFKTLIAIGLSLAPLSLWLWIHNSSLLDYVMDLIYGYGAFLEPLHPFTTPGSLTAMIVAWLEAHGVSSSFFPIVNYTTSFIGAYWFTLLSLRYLPSRSEWRLLIPLLPLTLIAFSRPYIEYRRAFYLFPIILPHASIVINRFSNLHSQRHPNLVSHLMILTHVLWTNVYCLVRAPV